MITAGFFPYNPAPTPLAAHSPMRNRTLRRFASFYALLLTALLASCSSAPTAPAGAADGPVVIQQSPNDDRAYRYVTLNNAMQVLMVSDPETDKAAASLVVFRGSHHEPEAYPGLAHFLEHMLFIGTEKYPDVDGYQHFIAQHGGSSNAYTAGDHTNYFFDIQPEYFPQAMDRFSQFFISPLLAADYVAPCLRRALNVTHVPPTRP